MKNLKNKIGLWSALAGMTLLLTACPYASSVPIAAPSEVVSKTLFGKWIAAADMEYDDPTYYSIGKYDEKRYEVVEFVYSSYDKKYTKTTYLMHESPVNGKTFMNVQEITGGDYNLYMMEIGADEFTLFEISENVDEKFSNSVDLLAFIEKNMNLSFFYTTGERKFVRK